MHRSMLSHSLIVLALLLLAACHNICHASQKAEDTAPAGAKSPLSQTELRTTDGAIALGNFEAQIAGEERLASAGSLTVAQRLRMVELLVMRGQFLGCIADYERAEERAEQLVRDAPTDGQSFLARAQVHAVFHRFGAALADLTEAERLGFQSDRIEALRAVIFQATGRYDEALALRQRLAQVRPDIRALGAEASVRADREEIDMAESLFVKAQHYYRDVSPFPVAWLYVQQGLMWMREDKLERARELFEAAHTRLPSYATAQGHLAVVEAALGRQAHTSALLRMWMHEDKLERAWALFTAGQPRLPDAAEPERLAVLEAALGRYERAITLLRPLAHRSDDPEYAAQLARILGEVGQADEAHHWRDVAATRYDELMARHPEAFVDHAAAFWLAAGSDPHKGLLLAEQNLGMRKTPRAYELVLQAALATRDTARVCRAAEHTRSVGQMGPRLQTLVSLALAVCGQPPVP